MSCQPLHAWCGNRCFPNGQPTVQRHASRSQILPFRQTVPGTSASHAGAAGNSRRAENWELASRPCREEPSSRHSLSAPCFDGASRLRIQIIGMLSTGYQPMARISCEFSYLSVQARSDHTDVGLVAVPSPDPPITTKRAADGDRRSPAEDRQQAPVGIPRDRAAGFGGESISGWPDGLCLPQ